MKKYIVKSIDENQQAITGTVDFVKPLIIKTDATKSNSKSEEYNKYLIAVQNIKEFLWDKISSTNERQYAKVLMLIEDPVFTNDIKKLIKKNKETAVNAVYLVSNKFKNMYLNVEDKSMQEKGELIKYIEYLLLKQFSLITNDSLHDEDAIYLVNSLDLYTVAILDDLNPKAIIVKEHINNEFIGFEKSNPSIFTLEGDQKMFNNFTFGEDIIVEPKVEISIEEIEIPEPNDIFIAESNVIEEPKEVIIIEEPKEEILEKPNVVHIHEEYMPIKEEIVSIKIEEIEEFDKSQVILRTYINDVTKKQKVIGNAIINTNKLFLEKEPTIEQQVTTYENIIDQCSVKDISFVLLNVDSLNIPNWLKYGNYVSDLLVKGIRLSYLNEELFKNQIKALTIAAKKSENGITILLPLVSTNEEFMVLKEEIETIRQELIDNGEEVGKIKTSIILETPALAYDLTTVLDEVDEIVLDIDEFTQYIMSIEKNNQLFKHLHQPLNPVVLKIIKKLLKQVNDESKKLIIQGISVNEPEVFIALMGLGAKNLVVSKHFKETAYSLAEKFNNEKTFDKINEVMKFKTSRDVIEEIEIFIEK